MLASSQRGDRILDPFLGSGTTAVIAEQLGRSWLGCDLNATYLKGAIQRIETAQQMSDEDWFWHDRKRQDRRHTIRSSSSNRDQ